MEKPTTQKAKITTHDENNQKPYRIYKFPDAMNKVNRIFLCLFALGQLILVGGQQGTVLRTDLVDVAYDVWTLCPQFSTQLTQNGQTNGVVCRFELCPNDQIYLRMCTNGGSCVADPYLRLYDVDNVEVFSNDDYCGLCSGGNYIASGSACGNYSLQQGCYSQGSCMGQVSIYRAQVVINPATPEEINTLSSLYLTTGGENWDWPVDSVQWDFSSSTATDRICSLAGKWYGVSCDCARSNTNCHVVGLALSGMGMVGEISNVSFNRLTFLDSLDLSSNLLHGSIPSSIGSLAHLRDLTLAENLFSGTLPEELADLSQSLTFLRLLQNSLEGSFPDIFSDFNFLQELELGFNSLRGTLPDSLCGMRSLLLFNVGGNDLSGTIPDCMYNDLTLLKDLDLHGNYFTGTISEKVSNFTALNIIKLSHNHFVGTLPMGIFSAIYNAWVFVDHNHFTGSISENFPVMRYVEDLDLSYNKLSGTLPEVFRRFRNLYYLNIEHNKFSGSLQGVFDLSLQTSLRALVLGANKLTGTIPGNLFRWGLVTFSAYSNCFSNVIPKTVCQAKNLKTLVLDGMQTSPFCRTDLVSSKTFLPLYRKQNSRIVKCLVSHMPRLRVLHLSGLGLEGNALEKVKRVGKYLDHLSLSYNQLSGTIPRAMQIKRWRKLDLSFNFFNGVLDPDFNTVMLDPSLISDDEGVLTDDDNYTDDVYYYDDDGSGDDNDDVDDDGDDDGDDDDGDDDGDDDDDAGNDTFDDDYYTFNASAPFSSDIFLDINHLSGTIPRSLLGNAFDDADNEISVIDGNLFSCNYDKAQIPYRDPAWDRYDCGSNSFNASYYFYLVAIGFLLIVSLAYTIYFEFKLQPIIVSVSSHIVAILSKHELPQHQDLEKNDLSRVYMFYKTLSYIEKVFVVVLFYLLLCMTPIYSIISVYFSSYTYSYAWTVSAAYKQGNAAAAVELVFFVILVVFLAVVWRNPQESGVVIAEMLSSSGRGRRSSVRSSVRNATPAARTIRSQPSMSVQLAKQVTMVTSYMFSTPFMKWLIVFGVEFGLVGAMNLGFVYITITGTRSQVFAAQVALTVFGFIWCSRNIEAFTTFVEAKLTRANFFEGGVAKFSVGYFYNMCKKKMEIAREHYWLQLVMTGLNNIWISVVIVAFVSRNCFYYALVNPGTITSTYQFETCAERDIYGTVLYCTEYSYQPLDSTYTPPFTYSYQCASVIVVYFAPSLMYTCTIDSFIIPLMQLAVAYILKQRNRGKTVHYAEDHHYNGPPTQDPAIALKKQRSLYMKLVKIIKEATVTSFLVPIKVLKVKREIPTENATSHSTKLCIEEIDEAIESQDTVSDGYYVYLRMAGHYSGEVYVSSTQEAIKVLSYMFLVLTFGYAFPPLGVAICATMVIYIRFLQWKMRCFLTKVWGYAKLDLQGSVGVAKKKPPKVNKPSIFSVSSAMMKRSLYKPSSAAPSRATSTISQLGTYIDEVDENCEEDENGNGDNIRPFVPLRHSINETKADNDDSMNASDHTIGHMSAYNVKAVHGVGSVAPSPIMPTRNQQANISAPNFVFGGGKSGGSKWDVLSRNVSRVVSFHVDYKLEDEDSASILGVSSKSKLDPEEEMNRVSRRQLALHSCLLALDQQCIGFADMLYKAKWPVLWTACCFYSFFLFDTVGGEQGVANSYWTLLLLWFLPGLIYLVVEKGEDIWDYLVFVWFHKFAQTNGFKWSTNLSRVAVEVEEPVDDDMPTKSDLPA